MITKDFSPQVAYNLVKKNRSDLTVITANKKFQTPTLFFPGTLLVSMNGQMLGTEEDNGFDEVSTDVFEMKEIIPASAFLQVTYLEQV